MKGLRNGPKTPEPIDAELLTFIRHLHEKEGCGQKIIMDLLQIPGPKLIKVTKSHGLQLLPEKGGQAQLYRIQRARKMSLLRQKYGQQIAALQASINKLKPSDNEAER